MRLLIVLAVTASVGCGYTTLEASRVPNPVTLGPVDRVGGHRSSDGTETTVRTVSTKVRDYVSVSTDEKRYGNTVVVTQTTNVTKIGNGQVTSDLMDATEGRPQRDVRIDGVGVDGDIFIAYGLVIKDQNVGLKGRVVEVRRDR